MLRTDMKQLIERTKRFYKEVWPGCALIQIKSIKGVDGLPIKPLNQWNFPQDNIAYLEERAKSAEHYWNLRKNIVDDMFPSIAPWYGIAEHTAFIGGNVEFFTETSYNHKIIDTIRDIHTLRLNPENMWMKMILEGMDYYQRNWSDKFVVKLRGADGPMDIANIVRGNDLFFDFYDEPELTHKLMQFCADAAIFSLKHQLEHGGKLEGGVLTGFDVWLPGYAAGHLSEDASCLCSQNNYEEFGKPYTQKVLDQFECAFLHTHSLGKKNIPQFASMEKFIAIEISNDPNADRAIDVLRKYSDVLKEKIVIVLPTKEEIENNLDLLRKHKMIIWYDAASLEDAQETVDFVRQQFGF